MSVRTRFAPSPTGYIHVGGLRTALFAWLVARHANGQFVLRIEDTDKSREVAGAKEHILKSLAVLGLDYDEGPNKDGPYGPYIQSERLDIYKKWADKLLATGRAYRDPYAPSEIEQFKQTANANKQAYLYRRHRPDKLETEDSSKPIRFKSDPKSYKWHDEVMGELSFSEDAIDDFILLKSDGYPTYNFAHIIDDIEMKISHVIRGQEFLSSVPNYLNMYEALHIDPPIYATMPHILGPDGKKKLSKRDGAKDILEYINEGYLPDALISFIATLGWNDGTTQEIFTKEELINKFELARVQKSSAKFDDHRLNWVNGSLIRSMELPDLYKAAEQYLPDEAKSFDEDYKLKVLSLVQERLKYFSELDELTELFFKDLPVNKSLIEGNNKLNQLTKDELVDLLTKTKQTLGDSSFSEEDISKRLNELLNTTGQKPAVLFSLIRIATTQAAASPGLFETLEVLGRQTVLRRIDAQIAAIK